MAGELVKRMTFENGGVFLVRVYDLLHAPVDAIVNAANGGLSHGGGVAAAIATAAGSALDVEGRAIIAKRGRLAVGEAVATTAGKLPFKGVIHAVGPRLGDGDEELKIARALLAAFRIAHDRGWKSVAFPGISSGIFSVPHATCARAYLRAVETFFRREEESSLRTIMLCLFRGPLLEAVRAVLPST